MLKKLFITSVFLGLCALAATVWLWNDYQTYLKTPISLPENAIFEVKKGFSFNKVVKELEQQSIKVNPLYLKLYARHSKLGNQVKAGVYDLGAEITPVQLLSIITSGRSVSHRFTIIEGSTFKQVLAALENTKYLEYDLSDLDDKALLERLGIQYSHPEGLFLAETYSFERNTKASSLLKRAHQHLQNQLKEAWEQKQDKLPYKNAYESLIMASIVEKETARPDERPIIAGVFTRRLEKGMRLQTDPTVIYGMGDSYKGNIRRSDLRKPTPYNTYVIPALPPTPIAMVGREAIKAALNPESGKALFFVAKGDGSHYFSVTLKEHNEAVRQYQLNRRKDYRSSP